MRNWCLTHSLFVLQVLQFPVQMLIRFWVNHHLLDIFQRPLWRVVKGRSREYVIKVVAGEEEDWDPVGHILSFTIEFPVASVDQAVSPT